MRNARRQPSSPRSRVRGVALVEAMVGILIFAFGVVGLIGLQMAMTRAQGSAKYRADAAYLGSQVLGQMWVDRANLGKYDTGGQCASYVPCTDWQNKVGATLPGGGAQISVTPSTGLVALTVTWSTAAEGTHTHVLTSSVLQ
jgi:type IV pilus assembly protein PilV